MIVRRAKSLFSGGFHIFALLAPLGLVLKKFMNIESHVASFSRSASRYRGGWRLASLAQRLFVKKRAEGAGAGQDILIKNYDGDITLSLDKSSYMGRAVYWQGYYSASELLALESILKPDMHFIDVGANEGLFALFAAKRLPFGAVTAFEPVSYLYRRLILNVERNRFSNISAHNLGLADKPGKLTIYGSVESDLDDMLPTLYSSVGCETPLESIKLDTLDHFAAGNEISRVDVIKIDIEGAELPFLKGATGILEAFKPQLIVEMNRETFSKAGYTQSDVVSFLGEYGYSPFMIGRRGKLNKISSAELPSFCNVLFSVPK